MCGITGFFTKKAYTSDDVDSFKCKLIDMSSALYHRGPDQSGIYTNNKDVFLAHQRLSILDLSNAGLQPMTSHCGRYVLTYNGEIYNYQALKERLNASFDIKWRGHSDTEVLLECISRWGIKKSLIALDGMFAFAVYDIKKSQITLARDRFGEKPLYIYSGNDGFCFASELKSIEVFTSNLSLNEAAIAAQLRYSYIPAPYSIYSEVFKLSAGCFITVDLNQFNTVTPEKFQSYWCLGEVIKKGALNNPSYNSVDQAVSAVENALKESLQERVVADVKLGAFLSGGVDSTAIVCLMQEILSNNVNTFSIGFNDEHYNEAHYAKKVARVLGTEHHEYYLDESDVIDIIPRLADIYDEPFSDSSQLPTLMVSQFAKKYVTVALTGDGGDEIFCGYNRYKFLPAMSNKLQPFPKPIRKLSSYVLKSLTAEQYNKVISVLSKLIPSLRKYKSVGNKVHKLASIMDFIDSSDLYNKVIMTWPHSLLVKDADDLVSNIINAFEISGVTFTERMMCLDTVGYLQNDILTKVDRAGMAVSLETRAPFLDNELFALSWSLPIEYKFHKGQMKYPLKQIIEKRVPKEYMERPKAGFGVPIDTWLRDGLRDWAEHLLSRRNLEQYEFLDVDVIRKIWMDHVNEKANLMMPLWNVLMLLQWLEKRA